MTGKTYFTSKDARELINIYGFSLFPVHGITEDGCCTCGNPKCPNPGKHPATPNGFKDAANDIDHVLNVWGGRKHLNVGIATGAKSGVFVVDIDSQEGEEGLKALCSLPDTLTVKTAKGRHLFFKHPGHDVVTKKGVLPGVDIRGDGGYVVGPLSHHITGNVYSFVNPLMDVADAPQEILDLVTKKAVKDTPVPSISQLAMPSGSVSLMDNKWTADDARNHLSFIDPDIGYDDWIAVGMALHSEGFGFELWDDWSSKGSKYDAEDMVSHWRSFSSKGGVSYGTVVHMAKQKGWTPKGQKTTELPKPIKKETVDPETGEITEDNSLRLTDWVASKKYTGHAPDIDWLIEGTFQRGVPALLAAMGGLGKSFAVLDLCITIASPPGLTPRRILGGDVVEHGKCVFITAEDSLNSVHRRIEKICPPSLLQQTKENLIVVPMPEIGGPQLLVKENNEGLGVTDFYYDLRDQLCAMEDLKLFVIDPLQAFVGADITSRPESAQFMWTAFAHIAAQTKATMLCTHHMRKDGLKSIETLADAREAIRGTTGIIDGSRLVYSMWQASEEAGRAIAKIRDEEYVPNNFAMGGVVKSNDEEVREVTCFVRNESGVLHDVGVLDVGSVAVKPVKLNAIQTFVYDALVLCITNNGVVRSVTKDMPPVKCVTYDELKETLENVGYAEIMETENKTSAQQIKSATQSARVALKKYGKINFNGRYIWNFEDEGNES